MSRFKSQGGVHSSSKRGRPYPRPLYGGILNSDCVIFIANLDLLNCQSHYINISRICLTRALDGTWMEEPLLSPSWRNSTPWCLSCMSRCSDVIVAVKTNVMATSFTIIAVTRKTGYKTVTQDIRHKKDKDSLIGLSLIHPDVTSAKWLLPMSLLGKLSKTF